MAAPQTARATRSLLANSKSISRVKIPQCLYQTRSASTYTEMTDLSEDVVPDTSFRNTSSEEQIKSFNPLARSRRRKTQLPPSRYQFRPPKYYRGPLHPHQPPPPSDPSSRLFIPGPFSLPRLEETYHHTLAPDLLTLMYTHHPPGTLPGPSGPRLRSWDGSSPYHKNRPLRRPRGASSALPLLDRPVTFRNLPRLEKVHVHSFLREAGTDPDVVHVACMAVQAITNVRATVFRAKHTVHNFNLVKGKPCAVGVELRGEDMWGFLSKVVEVVMPRIKEYKGVSGGSGDGSGDISWGFSGEVVGGFPEVEVNYDAYPPKMIPGIDITCCTTATNDRDARLLLSSLGVPFHGKHVN